MMVSSRTKIFFKSVFNGIAGIFIEIIAALLFIFAGLFVCLFWWELIR